MREKSTRTLLQSTAVIFALMAVLPLLTFAYVLQRLGAIQELEYEAALAFALLVSLLGFGVFRAVMLRVSRVLTALGAPAPDGAAPRLDPPERRTVPALGKILELEELPALVDPLSTLWKAEAEPYVGGQVVISVRNSPQPIRGLLCQATDDGLLVETGTARRGITYQRLLAIEADRALSLAS